MDQKKHNPEIHRRQWRRIASLGRRRGVVAVYVALLLTVLLGISAIVVDLGFAYRKQADLQKACDNAALAGASGLRQGYVTADARARENATSNGYTSGVNGVTVTTDQPMTTRLRVTIATTQATFFARIFRRDHLNISAKATAEYTSYAGMTVSNNGNVASISAALVNNGPFALGPKGTTAYNSYGDIFSAMYTNNGSALNNRYDPNGYNFILSVPSDFKNKTNSYSGEDHSKLWVEIFDPESSGDYDEEHSASSEVKALARDLLGTNPSSKNKTKYTVYYDALNDQGDVTTSTEITSREFDPSKSDYTDFNKKWTQGMLEVNLNSVDLTQGRLRLQVKSSDGASENGFYVRTGPGRSNTTISDSTWESRYGPGKSSNGTTFVAEGRTSFNFWKEGTANVDLGYVPQTAAGGTLTITYYDLEGGKSLKLYSSNNSNSGIGSSGKTISFQKVDGLEATYAYTLPSNFTGGTFNMAYNAGRYDSSSWQVSYPGPGKLNLRLVE